MWGFRGPIATACGIASQRPGNPLILLDFCCGAVSHGQTPAGSGKLGARPPTAALKGV